MVCAGQAARIEVHGVLCQARKPAVLMEYISLHHMLIVLSYALRSRAERWQVPGPAPDDGNVLLLRTSADDMGQQQKATLPNAPVAVFGAMTASRLVHWVSCQPVGPIP